MTSPTDLKAKEALEKYAAHGSASSGYDVLRYTKQGSYVTREEMEAAVEAEREACEAVCAPYLNDLGNTAPHIADEIRARKGDQGCS